MARKKTLREKVNAQQAEIRSLKNKARKQKKKFEARGYGTDAIDRILSTSPWPKGYRASQYTLTEQNKMYAKYISQLKWKMKNTFTYTIKGYEENMKTIAEQMGVKFIKSRKVKGKWTGPQYSQYYEIEGHRFKGVVSATVMTKMFEAFHDYLVRHPELYDDSDRIKRQLHRFAVELGVNEDTAQADINAWLDDRITEFLQEEPDDWQPDIDLF